MKKLSKQKLEETRKRMRSRYPDRDESENAAMLSNLLVIKMLKENKNNPQTIIPSDYGKVFTINYFDELPITAEHTLIRQGKGSMWKLWKLGQGKYKLVGWSI